MATKKKMVRAPRKDEADQHAAEELVLYIDNTSDLSLQGPSGQGRSVALNALKKWKKGTYDPKLAVKLFGYLVETGAKRYAKEMGSDPWNRMFTPATRRLAAEEMEKDFRWQAKNGELDHLNKPKIVSEKSRVIRERVLKSGARSIPLPNLPDWEQIDGDMNPGTYGGTIARNDGGYLELIKIQPVREYIGDDEAKDVGFPFWTRVASYDLADLNNPENVKVALGFIGMSRREFDELEPQQRALTVASALMDYGTNVEEGRAGWSKQVLGNRVVKWASGETAGSDYLADEDEEFRREILGEDIDEEEEAE